MWRPLRRDALVPASWWRAGNAHLSGRLCTIAVSLGEAATLIWPYVEDDLLRLSVGLEDVADLEEDLRTGLQVAMAEVSLARS